MCDCLCYSRGKFICSRDDSKRGEEFERFLMFSSLGEIHSIKNHFTLFCQTNIYAKNCFQLGLHRKSSKEWNCQKFKLSPKISILKNLKKIFQSGNNCFVVFLCLYWSSLKQLFCHSEMNPNGGKTFNESSSFVVARREMADDVSQMSERKENLFLILNHEWFLLILPHCWNRFPAIWWLNERRRKK